MQQTLKYFPLLITFVLISCAQEQCQNSNPIFNQQSPESAAYRDALADVLKSESSAKFEYIFDDMVVKEDGKHILVSVNGNKLCAKMTLKVLAANTSLDEITPENAMSYRGAELKGLKFMRSEDLTKTEFIFTGIGEIIE